MINLKPELRLSSNGQPVETDPAKFGPLRVSTDVIGDADALRSRFAEDGYLYLPGFYPKEIARQARLSVLNKFAAEDVLDPAFPVEDGVMKPDIEMYFRPDVAEENAEIERLIYGPELMGLFEFILGGEVLHYDFTWMRAVAHGLGTCPHCDIVYMGRGTTQLYTAWTPLGDIPLELGGLIVLEGSHRHYSLRETYGTLDVDVMCSNLPGQNILVANGYDESGAITLDPHALREELGGRWLTAEYNLGDLLIFGMYTVHGSLDNQTDRIRLSTDSRYQLASEPVDPRWAGEARTGHGSEGKKQLIC